MKKAIKISEVTERHRIEKVLRQSENLYQSLFDNMLNGFAYCRMHFDQDDNPADFTYIAVNSAFERLTGLKDVVGRKVSDVIPGIREADPGLIRLYGRVSKGSPPEKFEMFVESLKMWFSISVYCPRKGYFVAIFDVITERKMAEENLRQTHDYLENLLNYANAPIIVWNPELIITRFNHAFKHLTAYGSDEVIGKKLDILFPGQSRPDSIMQIAKTSVGERWESVEIPILRKDGGVRIALWNSATLYSADGKTVIATIAQGQDITDRKKAEESQAQIISILEATPDFVAMTDAHDGHYIYINKAGRNIAGIGTGEDVTKYKISDFHPEWSNKLYATEILPTASKEGVWSGECAFLSRGGKEIPTHMVQLSHKDPNGEVGMFSTISRDISDRKIIVEQLQKSLSDLKRSNTELEQFAYVASHDLQEPLRMVASFTQLLAKKYGDKLDPEALEFIRFAVDGATRMQVLINDLLEYSRVGTWGKPFEPVDCHTVLENARNNLQASLDNCHGHITYGFLPVVRADQSQLLRLFQNLIDNSLKFHGDQPPQIHISAEM